MKTMYVIISAVLLLSSTAVQGQKYFTRSGKISFFSDAPMEKIEAHNQQGTAVIDFGSGAMEFAVLIKSFQFEKALMQEHFNENYLESDQYPKSSFKGQVVDYRAIDLKKDGTYKSRVKGTLTIKNVSKEVESEAIFTVSKGNLTAKTSFSVAVADYNITIPKLVAEKIAKNVLIKADIALNPLAQ
jgi:polyisoprenoid-binding protein YceI